MEGIGKNVGSPHNKVFYYYFITGILARNWKELPVRRRALVGQSEQSYGRWRAEACVESVKL